MASNRIEIDISRSRSLTQRLFGVFSRNYTRRLEDALEQGARNGTADVLDEWKRESVDLAPLEFGALRRGIDTNTEQSGSKLGGVITSSAVSKKGRKRFDYATYIHDRFPRTSFKSPTTPGTIPKYLDKPLADNGAKWAKMIEAEMKAEAKRRGF
ncbi:HK97 gp10 family phage protein [Paenibacillus agricola]|uniref:HK97 gp10 family phage protein n=1 Tax=Paenibacillus agricola TaxID=2716264 RepID=A0ABX0J419_9BACL|nr:HK97 gp10 family phage protein [Paenibacillus agricola]NHN31132.1 HK97 gp10 family phage protein [Paenibacillus agricola]